jgi:hypothetical protein
MFHRLAAAAAVLTVLGIDRIAATDTATSPGESPEPAVKREHPAR